MSISNSIVLKELLHKINGICFDVHNSLGRFCREKQYSDKLEEFFKQNKIGFKREVEINKLIESPQGKIADFVIENKIILDVKAKRFITKEDYYQMARYLRAANIELGLIVNFRNTYLKPKRVLNGSYSDHSGRNSDY